MTIDVSKFVNYLVEQRDIADTVSVYKASIVVVEQPAPGVDVHKAVGVVVEQVPSTIWYRTPLRWQPVIPYVNVRVVRATEAGDTRVTEDGDARTVHLTGTAGNWVIPAEGFVKHEGVWKKFYDINGQWW